MEYKPSKEFSLLNIDKPSGPTSFQVSQFIRRRLNLNKTSHMGTLDPQVSGVLPITLGRACRLSDYFMHKEKEYVGIMRLHSEVEEDKLKQKIRNFIGKITQLPPVRSRVKRAIREREVKSFEILEIKGKDVLFKTEVQAGTYIRKLCDDIGRSLAEQSRKATLQDLPTGDSNRLVEKKIGGAHMLELRRTKAGIFDEKTAITLYEFEKALKENYLDKYLIPAEEAIKKVLPSVQIKKDNLKQILVGKPLMKDDFTDKKPQEEKFAAFIGERFIGVYRKINEGDILAKAEFVFN
ncbi:RNA-guided pseudouridylation complex pseudouridine synthase subunit Cbf5 [Candidatus Pacearchaeota archaeon]|nr:RNA-guided pseudouridylation complex pseudouridine synthase subunit Cbf5 [Candidatus Pacearchaeota archaeon]